MHGFHLRDNRRIGRYPFTIQIYVSLIVPHIKWTNGCALSYFHNTSFQFMATMIKKFSVQEVVLILLPITVIFFVASFLFLLLELMIVISYMSLLFFSSPTSSLYRVIKTLSCIALCTQVDTFFFLLHLSNHAISIVHSSKKTLQLIFSTLTWWQLTDSS